jgi:hypothetical protein
MLISGRQIPAGVAKKPLVLMQIEDKTGYEKFTLTQHD